ncbi:hypothetical protein BU17DRAFT_54520 [Hysterangium stoloniferum]|nr:hypothetical protein BU17DRAFT_54520 [Hysterangium stoloniferum]
MSSSSDLASPLFHTIAYLTRPLSGRYSATTIDLLRFTLGHHLTAQLESNWYPAEPQRGSSRRCLFITPHGVPPRPIYYACQSARISWEEWLRCLGNVGMALFIDPGCVSVSFPGVNKTHIVWSTKAEIQSKRSHSAKKQHIAAPNTIEEDDEEELFKMIRDEVCSSTSWTPSESEFPAIPRPTIRVPESAVSIISTSSLFSTHSCNSSHSDDTSSSDFSFGSIESTGTTMTPTSYVQRRAFTSLPSKSCVEVEDGTTHGRIHVNASKTEATPYDGGKTKVLTGGVMLGMKGSAPLTTSSTPRFAKPPQAAFARVLVHA